MTCWKITCVNISPNRTSPEINFAWQGGEPTLMGLDFFRRAVKLQRQYSGGKTILNAIQTNGILLTDEWCAFLREHGFLVGLSIDGPAELHDGYRMDKAGRPTHARVMAAWDRLKAHGVDVNTMTVVHRQNAAKPLEVYEFLKRHGAQVMQFIPLVERAGPSRPGRRLARRKPGPFSGPPDPLKPLPDPAALVTPWSVLPEDFGEFLCRIFDHWVRRDVGTVFVTMFDWQLAIEMGLGSPTCVFSETCGRALALEHNGDVYACDHYVYPEHRRGNIARDDAGGARGRAGPAAIRRRQTRHVAGLLPPLRGAQALPGGMSQAPLHDNSRRRTGASISLSLLQTLLQPHQASA